MAIEHCVGLRAELGRLGKVEEVEAENHAASVSRVRWSCQLDKISLAVRQVGARWRAMSSGAVPTLAAEMTERSSARSVNPANFYARIPVLESFARLTDPALYRPLPEDWVIGLSDVVASTEAIRAGKYKSVNVAGAALIAAVSECFEPSRLCLYLWRRRRPPSRCRRNTRRSLVRPWPKLPLGCGTIWP